MSWSLTAPQLRQRRAWAIAFVLLGLGLNAALFLVVSSRDWTWQNDFGAYFLAAQRMAEDIEKTTRLDDARVTHWVPGISTLDLRGGSSRRE